MTRKHRLTKTEIPKYLERYASETMLHEEWTYSKALESMLLDAERVAKDGGCSVEAVRQFCSREMKP